ncbi:MAG: bifunctional diaminohydroxyphosphoribosylaminopyrimidine deaminase/5-amino-6-(5-phosphoribosylamino)uracil reductase RibD [Bacteroidetes bacterium]|nr:MAG: bifunctional diaminohydroxyphosphoribosylaminopyrimidine deaminase/5-amino-6-(5-phosphoribosylamino)uracil reductase RibD [Bacteroidota bacterium]
MAENQKYMKLALKLARKGAGWVNPNPMVGAVIVKDNVVIGQGYHEYFGGPHAEVNAFKSCTRSPRGATLYVTLEPCVHQGKTPPCADLIVQKGIRKVVIAMKDPNPKVDGEGIRYLKSKKVVVESGLLDKEAAQLNEAFSKFITTRKPFCLFKGAMTLDGKIATSTGDSRWISGDYSRLLAHRLRHEYSAIMVGIGTVLKDNPKLDARRSRKISKNPLKVVVDSFARISMDSSVLTSNPQLTLMAVTKQADQAKLTALRRMGAQVVVCPEKNEQVDLEYLMLALGSMDIDSVLLEGGGTLAFSAFRDRIIDKVLLFVAPKVIGGKKAPTILEGDGIKRIAEAIPLRISTLKMLKEDILIEGYPQCLQES